MCFGQDGVCQSSDADPEAVRAQLVAFYAEHNPEKMEQIDAVLERYAGDVWISMSANF